MRRLNTRLERIKWIDNEIYREGSESSSLCVGTMLADFSRFCRFTILIDVTTSRGTKRGGVQVNAELVVQRTSQMSVLLLDIGYKETRRHISFCWNESQKETTAGLPDQNG